MKLALLGLIPALLIRYKQTDLLLPYGVALGMLVAYGVFRLIVSSVSLQLHVGNQLGIYMRVGGIDPLLIIPFLACIAACLAYILLRRTSGSGRVVISFIVRSAAIYLLFFSFSLSNTAVNHAQQAAEQKAAVARTAQAQAIRDKTTLNPDLQVYQPALPPGYALDSTSGSYQSESRDHIYDSYRLSYAIPGAQGQSITVEGSPLKASLQLLDACRATHGLDAQAPALLCKVILTTKNGTAVAGYRSPGSMQSLGYNPQTITEEQIRTITPENFYVIIGGELLQIQYGGIASNPGNPITPAFIENAVNGLHPMDAGERQKFIDQYVKPPTYRQIIVHDKSTDNKNGADVVMAIISSVYLASLLWALQRVFEKAGCAGWAAYVPLYNVWVFAKIGGMSAGWLLVPLAMFLLLVFGTWTSVLTFVAYFGPAPLYLLGIATVIIFFAMSFLLAKRFSGPAIILGPLTFMPPFIGLFILGFSTVRYEDPYKWDPAESSDPAPPVIPTS